MIALLRHAAEFEAQEFLQHTPCIYQCFIGVPLHVTSRGK